MPAGPSVLDVDMESLQTPMSPSQDTPSWPSPTFGLSSMPNSYTFPVPPMSSPFNFPSISALSGMHPSSLGTQPSLTATIEEVPDEEVPRAHPDKRERTHIPHKAGLHKKPRMDVLSPQDAVDYGRTAKAENTALFADKRAAQKEAQDLRAKLSAAGAERLQFLRREQELESTLALSREECRLLERNLENCRAELKQHHVKHTEVASMLNEAQRKISRGQSQLDELTEAVKSRDAGIASLQQSCAQLTHSVHDLEAQLTSVQRQKCDETQALTDQLARAKKERDDEMLAWSSKLERLVAVGRMIDVLSSTDDHP